MKPLPNVDLNNVGLQMPEQNAGDVTGMAAPETSNPMDNCLEQVHNNLCSCMQLLDKPYYKELSETLTHDVFTWNTGE